MGRKEARLQPQRSQERERTNSQGLPAHPHPCLPTSHSPPTSFSLSQHLEAGEKKEKGTETHPRQPVTLPAQQPSGQVARGRSPRHALPSDHPLLSQPGSPLPLFLPLGRKGPIPLCVLCLAFSQPPVICGCKRRLWVRERMK